MPFKAANADPANTEHQGNQSYLIDKQKTQDSLPRRDNTCARTAEKRQDRVILHEL